MESLKELYKIGSGPSSSHTMGPQRAALEVQKKYPSAKHYEVYLYGSLSLTGKGHLTDYIIEKTLGKENVNVHFKSDSLDYHPNGMVFEIYDKQKQLLDTVTVYSIGGGSILFEGMEDTKQKAVYPHYNMQEIIAYVEEERISLYDYVLRHEDADIEEYLLNILETMFKSVETGLSIVGTIPGRLQLKRVAKCMHQQAVNTRRESERERLLISSYAYAVSEQNACGQTIVTAPTCGASGVMPAVLYYCYKQLEIPKKELVKALGVAGIFGNTIKYNATISGADGGCQAEVGSACSMAASAYGWVLELSNSLIEYSAEMGLEHNLGLTCDPVGGYVQIPCIERNGFGALRAIDAALYAKQLGYLRKNKISFDAVVRVMKETGKDLSSDYKETSLGGLAKEYGIIDEN
ncbi:MAG: L-serine ammonia-lyase, iron-sulfur-dependent, subunit alpha [Coprobacillaceae bacterium]